MGSLTGIQSGSIRYIISSLSCLDRSRTWRISRGGLYTSFWTAWPEIAVISRTTKPFTSSTAQGGGGSFKNRKPIGEVGCCESGMAKRIHWWTERCLRSPLCLSLSLTIYLPTSLSSVYLSIYRSIYLSLSLFHLITYLRIYLSTYLAIYLSTYLPIFPSIYLSVYLCICLPVHLWCSVIQCIVV